MRVIGHRKQILLVRYEGLITRNVRFTYSRLIWLNLSSRQNGPLCIVGRLGRGRNESARGTMEWGKRGSSRLFSLFIVACALAIFIEMPSWNLCGGESDKTKFGWRSSLVTQCIPTLHWADSALYCPDIFPDRTCIPKFLSRKTTRRRFPFQG